MPLASVATYIFSRVDCMTDVPDHMGRNFFHHDKLYRAALDSFFIFVSGPQSMFHMCLRKGRPMGKTATQNSSNPSSSCSFFIGINVYSRILLMSAIAWFIFSSGTLASILSVSSIRPRQYTHVPSSLLSSASLKPSRLHNDWNLAECSSIGDLGGSTRRKSSRYLLTVYAYLRCKIHWRASPNRLKMNGAVRSPNGRNNSW